MRRGKEVWHHASTHFNSQSYSWPSDTLVKLKSCVSDYFDLRMRLEKHDFAGTILESICKAAAQQAEDLNSVWRAYDKLIAEEDRGAVQQNRMLFLIYSTPSFEQS